MERAKFLLVVFAVAGAAAANHFWEIVPDIITDALIVLVLGWACIPDAIKMWKEAVRKDKEKK